MKINCEWETKQYYTIYEFSISLSSSGKRREMSCGEEGGEADPKGAPKPLLFSHQRLLSRSKSKLNDIFEIIQVINPFV